MVLLDISRSSKCLLLLLSVIVLVLNVVNSVEFVNLEYPVQEAHLDEVKSLPDFKDENIKFKHYSGYLEATDDNVKQEDKEFLHYWFVESESENHSKDPLLLWLNGGPGCSSISSLLRANGPFFIDENGNVKRNPYSMNRRANVLYIDAPVGTGYSYSPGSQDVSTDDDKAAKQIRNAFKNFFKKFPLLKDRDLYLAGESYAAVYLALLGAKHDKVTTNLKGVVIGNGYTDAKRLGESYIMYSYYHGMMDSEGWRDVSTYCCDGNTPDHKKCHFSGTSPKCLEIIKRISSFVFSPMMGFNPQNIYETDNPSILPLQYQPPLSMDLIRKPVPGEEHGWPWDTNPTHSPNLPNDVDNRQETRYKRSLEDDQQKSDNTIQTTTAATTSAPTTAYCKPSMELIIGNDLISKGFSALMKNNDTTDNINQKLDEAFAGPAQRYLFNDKDSTPLSGVYCAYKDKTNYHVNYLNREDVKRALHIPERLTRQFQYCSQDVFKNYKMIYPFMKGGISPLIESILGSVRKIKLLMYNGDVDLIANFVGNEWFVDDLKKRSHTPHRPWKINRRIVGFLKRWMGVVWYTVKGAGHSPATEKPFEVQNMIERFMSKTTGEYYQEYDSYLYEEPPFES